MEGFFTDKQVQSKSRPSGKNYSCASCKLYKTAKRPRMQPFGNFKKGILNLGEAPGEIEDSRGRQWQGKAGRELQRAYRKLGIDLFEDCLNINAVNCRPVDSKRNNRTPINYEVDCCRAVMVDRIIREYKPRVLVLLGGAALYSFLGTRWKKDLGGIMKWRGWEIPDQDFKCWVCPVFHPSFTMRSEQEVETVWMQDLQKVVELLDKPFLEYKKPSIRIIDDLTILNNLIGEDIDVNTGCIAFDYETTGLKPHAKGHRIVCASVAVNENLVYSFMMPSNRTDRQPFIDILQNVNIDKIAANMKFEDTWSNVRLRTEVKRWVWDTMLASHILDNRPGITSLKFQVYVNFGIIDYASEILPYLKSPDKQSNSMNRINELLQMPGGQEKLLTYCAYDSIFEYRLATKQMKIMNFNFLPF